MTIEIKPVSGMEQLERWVAVHNEVRPDDPATAEAKALIRAEESERTDLLAYLDGVPVGTAMVTGDVQTQETGRPWVQVDVLPSYRGRGVGDALLRAASDHARQFGRVGFTCDASADDAYSLGFLQRRGFIEHRRWEKYELDLDSHDGVAPATPEGVEITCIADRPALLAGMHGVAAEVYPALGGHIGRHAESFVGWQAYTLGGPAALLDLALIAVAGDDVVGFTTAKAFDAATAELQMVAVLPPWRGRGIGTALVGSQVARANGTRTGRLIAWVPAVTGPGHVYRRVGFDQVRGAVELRGPLLS